MESLRKRVAEPIEAVIFLLQHRARTIAMFKQQGKAVGYVPHHWLGILKLKLRDAGYEEHDGPKLPRDGEIATFRRAFHTKDGLRQNHVQLVQRGSTIAVYAHTEPHTIRLAAHAISAMLDGASFSGGSKMLRNNLADVAFDLMNHSDAVDRARRHE
jgi:hypothetical protein